MKNYKYKIEHEGKSIQTNQEYIVISDELYNEIKNSYYEKPKLSDVFTQFKNVKKSEKSRTNDITNYYFTDLMSKVVFNRCLWSIEEVFNCKRLIEHFYSFILSKPKFFEKGDLVAKFKQVFRTGGGGICGKPSNFPLKTANEILTQYNINNNYYGFSCGWGVRLLAALRLGINYFGTDPNFLLTERLNEMSKDWAKCFDSPIKNILSDNSKVDIRTQGSEIFVPEWENKIGVAFSSPPYFDLEDYRIGDQSFKEGTSYENWLDGYMRKTIENVYKYLIKDGFLIMNIKNSNKHKLLDDCDLLIKNSGFVFHDEHTLVNIKRRSSLNNPIDTDEKIRVYKKK